MRNDCLGFFIRALLRKSLILRARARVRARTRLFLGKTLAFFFSHFSQHGNDSS
jgi:hypothetical protein